MNAIQMTHIDTQRIKLKSRGVNSQRKYDLPKARNCAACGKPIQTGSLVYHNKGYDTWMHFYAMDCVLDHNLTPEQQGYMAMATGGKRKVEKVEQRLSAPGELNPTGRKPVSPPFMGEMSERQRGMWQPGICTVTPSGQVMLPHQQPAALLPANASPIRVEIEIAPDTRPLLRQINVAWQTDHGLVVPVIIEPATRFCVFSRPLSPGSTVITHDVVGRFANGQERIIQSSPRLEVAQRVAMYHNQHYCSAAPTGENSPVESETAVQIEVAETAPSQ